MNFAMFKGSLLSLTKEHGGGWKREARGDEEESSTVAKALPLVLAAALSIAALSPSRAEALTADASVGVVNSTEELLEFNFNVSGHFWYPVDQMVFVGIGLDYQRFGDVTLVPVMGSAYVRLPFGSVMMPAMTFDMGYAFGNDAQMIWRVGGGLDVKLGRYSSLLMLGGYENLRKNGDFVYLRCGLLLEL